MVDFAKILKVVVNHINGETVSKTRLGAAFVLLRLVLPRNELNSLKFMCSLCGPVSYGWPRFGVSLKAKPRWADDIAIKAVYADARTKAVKSGAPYHVDHVVPLQRKLNKIK